MKRNIINILASFFLLSVFVFSCSEELNKADYDYVINPSKVPTGLTTGVVVDNMGTSAIISASLANEGDNVLLDKGIIVSEANNFTFETAGSRIFSSRTSGAGDYTVTVTGLLKVRQYYFRAYASTSSGIVYGEIKSFVTDNVTFSPYVTAFRPTVPADIADWVFDDYTGFNESGEDLVFLYSVGATTTVACYWDGEDLTLTSPLVRIANANDVLGYTVYAGWFYSPQTIMKVYITEDLDNLGTAVRVHNLDEDDNLRFTVPMAPYHGKSVYVVLVVELGDILIYNFRIEPPAA